jgi:hypothetical protein
MSDTSTKKNSLENSGLSGALPYEAPAGSPGELSVVCANCSYPVVREYDDQGNVKGFREEVAPQNEEQALAEGWLDHGLGLYCPTCSLAVLEEQARDREAGAESGVNGDIGEIIDAQVLRSFVPGISEATVQEFVRMFRSERLSKLRAMAGLEPLPIYRPVAKDEAQAEEF